MANILLWLKSLKFKYPFVNLKKKWYDYIFKFVWYLKINICDLIGNFFAMLVYLKNVFLDLLKGYISLFFIRSVFVFCFLYFFSFL